MPYPMQGKAAYILIVSRWIFLKLFLINRVKKNLSTLTSWPYASFRAPPPGSMVFDCHTNVYLGADCLAFPTTASPWGRPGLQKAGHPSLPWADRRLSRQFILIAKSFFLFSPHPDPLPLKGRRDKRQKLLAIALRFKPRGETQGGSLLNYRQPKFGL